MAKYVGFSGLVSSLKKKGMSSAAAKGTAANIGRAKYGKTKFQKAAKAGRKMGNKGSC